MEVIKLEQFKTFLQPRPRDSNKGNFGHVLIVGGELGYSGAVIMAANAALRVGAGLVSAAVRPENAAVLNINLPEMMCHGVHQPQDLKKLTDKASVIVIGPGLGKESWAREMLDFVLTLTKPLIVDADGLNILSENPQQQSNWILTPHPGEAARLLKTTSEVIQQDRISAVKKIQQQYGGTVILKGAGTLVLSDNGDIARCDAGNPGMATGGMGDVLSGVLGGLAAQGLSLSNSAKLGVLVHAMAGDLAAKKGERGMIAMDLMKYLRKLVN